MSEIQEETHYVKGSRRQKGYYRRKPYTYDHPTKAQRKIRAILARTAYDQGREKFGLARVVDEEGNVKEVPASAIPIMQEMKGIQVKPARVKPGPPLLSPLDRARRQLRMLIRAATVPPVSE